MIAAMMTARAVCHLAATRSPSIVFEAVNHTSGTTAKGKARESMTCEKISNLTFLEFRFVLRDGMMPRETVAAKGFLHSPDFSSIVSRIPGVSHRKPGYFTLEENLELMHGERM